MNTRGYLVLSLLLNILLVLLFLFQARPHSSPAIQNVSGEKTNNPLPNHASTRTVTRPPRIDWRHVESTDYQKYIANLRNIGCPEETIRDIIIADVNKLFEDRARETFPINTQFEFWKAAGTNNPARDAELVQKQIDLAKEKRQLLKTLLGVEVEDKSVVIVSNPLSEKYRFLSLDKQQQMIDLEIAFAAKEKALFGSILNPPPKNDPRYQKLLSDKEAEMLQLLTPQEIEEYEVRHSRTAELMRQFLGEFTPSEQEFREIFRLRKEFEKQYGPSDTPNLSAEQRDARVRAMSEMRGQLKTILGEQRFQDYEHETGFQRSKLKEVAAEFNLPKQAAYQALDISWTTQEEASRIRSDAALDETQRRAELSRIRSEAEASLNFVLGTNAYRSYLKNKPYWLNALPAANP